MTAPTLPVQPTCPVCGDRLTGSPWVCERCETPHHLECAEYFGGCAIFGCRDGHAPDRLEEGTWPTIVRVLRLFVLIRTIQVWLLTATILSLPALVVAQAMLGLRLAVLGSAVLFLSLVGLFVAGPLTVLGWVASQLCYSWLDSAVTRSTGRGLSLDRVRQGLPRVGGASSGWSGPWAAGLGVLAGGLLIAAGSAAASGPLQACGVIVGGASAMLAGVLWVSHHDRETIALFVRRFEASFTPLLEKRSSRPGADVDPTGKGAA